MNNNMLIIIDEFKKLEIIINELINDLNKPMLCDEKYDESYKKLIIIINEIEHDITKLTLFIKSDDSAQTIPDICIKLNSTITMAICWLKALISCSGNVLKQYLLDLSKKFLESIIQLMNKIRENLKNNEDINIVAAGYVFQCCKEIATIPKSNSDIIYQRIKKCNKLIKDGRKELLLLKCDESMLVNDLEVMNKNEYNDEFFDEDDMVLSPKEFQIVKPVIELYVGLFHTIKVSSETIKKIKSIDENQDIIIWMESILSSTNLICEYTDQLACAIYHPQEMKEIVNACQNLRENILIILNALKSNSNFVNTNDWMRKVCQTFQRAFHNINDDEFKNEDPSFLQLWQ